MNFSKRLFIICTFLVLSGCATDPLTHSMGEDPVNQEDNSDLAFSKYRTVDLTVRSVDVWDRIRKGYAIPDIDTEEVRQWENYYAKRPEYFARTANRGSKYLFYILEEIDKRKLPTELALLPFIESAFNPQAESSAKASGLWQFIPSTGKHFKLEQNWWVDERKDPIASTQAALDYLTYLFDFQEDWQLALASYNWGEGSVRRAMQKNRAENLETNYLSLKMPAETWNYIPKFQAIKNIVRSPEKYGLTLPDVGNEPYFVTFEKRQNIDVEVAAKFANMTKEEFLALNPSFKRTIILGKDNPTILLPIDKLAIFEQNLKDYDGQLKTWQEYTVEANDTVTSVAKKFGVSESVIRAANSLSTSIPLSEGKVLLIPGQQDARSLQDSRTPDARSSARNTATPTGKPGKPGNLATPTGKPGKPGNLATPTGKPGKPGNSATVKPAKRYVVRSGDTLNQIAQKHDLTVKQLMQSNGLKSSSVKVGQSLIIPKPI